MLESTPNEHFTYYGRTSTNILAAIPSNDIKVLIYAIVVTVLISDVIQSSRIKILSTE